MKKIFYFFTAAIILSSMLFTYSQPVPPSGLTAFEAQNMMYPSFVRLEWKSSTIYTLFNVYRKEVVNDTGTYFVRYKGLRHPMFNDYRVQPGKTYQYYVTAVNLEGESNPSNEAKVTLTGDFVTANVSGIVKNEETDEGIPGAGIAFFRTAGMDNMGYRTRTNEAGVFKISLPVGTYFLKTMAYGFVPEFYDNAHYFSEAAKIEVTTGSALNFDISLTPMEPPVMYTLSGKVTDSLGNPLRAGVGIFHVRDNTHHRGMYLTRTDSLGYYNLPVKGNDTVVVYAVPANREYYPEFWDNKTTYMEADRIFIDGNVENINFVLQHKPVYQNSIAGFVKNSSGEPVESFVAAIRKNSTVPFRRYTVQTDEQGAYNFSNLIPGKYILLSVPKEGYLPTFFTYDGAPTLRWREADSVMVTDISEITGINFTVLPLPEYGEGSIAGFVSNESGLGIEGAFVYAVNSNGDYAGYGLTDPSGNYRINGLATDNYQVVCDRIEYQTGTAVSTDISYQNNAAATVNFSLKTETISGVKNDKTETVTSFQLYQNYPNPFNPVTNIKFSIPEKSNVKITVYNLLGIQVAQLIDEIKDAGEHNVSFDASGFSSGVYFYKMEAGKYISTKKLTLLK